MQTRIKMNNYGRKILIYSLPLLIVVLIMNLQSLSNTSSQNFNVKDFGASGNGSHDDTFPIQQALDKAKTIKGTIKIFVPPGTYKLTSTLRIYKNTHLVLSKDAILLRSHNDTILVNGEHGSSYYGYKGEGNITIDGGIWDGNIEQFPDPFNAIAIARANNITIQNIEVRDIAGGHAIDLNSSKNVLIQNSKFLGFKDVTVDQSRYYSEAIQIAEHTKLGFSEIGVYDGTPNQNVTIQNCVFGASGTYGTKPWPVGIGNHGSVYNQFNTDIKILNNSFHGATFSAIRIFKWKNTTIQDNTFTDNVRAISFSNPNGDGESSKTSDGIQTSLPQSGSNLKIVGNIFEGTKQENIYAVGWPRGKEIAKIEKIIISNNYFTNQLGNKNSSNIYLRWINNVEISNNSITNAYRAIHLEYGSNIVVTHNKISDIISEIIYEDEPNVLYQQQGYSSNLSITENTFSRFHGVGLFLQYTDAFTIANNDIDASLSDSWLNVILVRNSTPVGKITGNTLSVPKLHQANIIKVININNDVYVSGNKINRDLTKS